MNAFNGLKPAKKRNLLTLFCTGLLFWFSISSLLPVLPLYVRYLGGSKQQIGLVMGCFAIGLLGSRVLLGRLADRRGRKIVILIGTAVVGLAPVGYMLANSVPSLMALRAFHGISIAAFATGYSALVVDISPAKQRGELIGYMSLVIPIGMAIGPALGGYLQAAFGYQLFFSISAGAGFLALVCASQVKEELELSAKQFATQPIAANPTNNRTFRQMLASPALVVPGIVLLLVGLLFGTLATFLPLFVEAVGVNFNAGLFYAFAAIASFSSRLVIGKASDRIGRGLFISLGLVCYTISMVLLATASTPIIFAIAAVLEGMGGGIVIPLSTALISDRSHVRERGKVYALCTGGFDLGIATAGPLFGWLSSSLNYSQMFSLAGSCAFLALIIFASKSSKTLLGSLRFALGQGKDAYAIEL